MPLYASRNILKFMNRNQFLKAIKRRRQELRSHRDQEGDDRCWADDYRLFAFVKDLDSTLETPSLEDGMVRCTEYYDSCHADAPPVQPPDAILNTALWDKDLERADNEFLLITLVRIQQRIVRLHHITDRPRTVADYQEIYDLLPEKIRANWFLGTREQFLQSEGRGPRAGCVPFWQSHEHCPRLVCTPFQWGMCDKKDSDTSEVTNG